MELVDNINSSMDHTVNDFGFIIFIILYQKEI